MRARKEPDRRPEDEASRLRFEGRLAYLDGRTKRARELNRRADAFSRRARRIER